MRSKNLGPTIFVKNRFLGQKFHSKNLKNDQFSKPDKKNENFMVRTEIKRDQKKIFKKLNQICREVLKNH